MRWISVSLATAALLGCVLFIPAQAAAAKTSAKAAKHAAAAAKTAPAAPVAKPLLPEVFAGWELSGAFKSSADAAQADPANAGVLKEYDFTDTLAGEYKRSGETLNLRALRFHDASGAYGAFTFYRQSGWPREQIGTGATSHKDRVLFWVGNTLIDANFSHLGPMSGSELRELASGIPVPDGSRALPPPILGNLPLPAATLGKLDGQTTHYALGAVGYTSAGGVLPADVVSFDRGAETVTTDYKLRSGVATLTVIDYPTPQLAAAQETRIRAYIEAGKKGGKSAQAAWPKPLQDSDLASIEVRRSGPLVAIVTGDAVPEESHKLLALVHFESELMNVNQPHDSEVQKTGKLLAGIALLVVIACCAALLLGFFLGGFRALYRIARGKPASSVFDTEFTSLHLRD